MRFTIVKERWYHKFLRKLTPKVNSRYQIHLSAHIGEKNDKWYLFDHISYGCDLTDNTHPLLENNCPYTSMEEQGPTIDESSLETESKEYAEEDIERIAGLKELEEKFNTIKENSIDVYDEFEVSVITFLTEIFHFINKKFQKKVPLEDTITQTKELHNIHQIKLWGQIQDHITECYTKSQVSDLPQT